MYSRSQPKGYLVNIFLLHVHLFINIIKPCDIPVIGCTNISGKETFELKFQTFNSSKWFLNELFAKYTELLCS